MDTRDLAADLRTPDEWGRLLKTPVKDPDGWRGSGDLPARPWTDPISLQEFQARMVNSTVEFRPSA